MTERVDFERLSDHDLSVLAGRQQKTILEQWQVRALVAEIKDWRRKAWRLEEQLDKKQTSEKEAALKPTYD